MANPYVMVQSRAIPVEMSDAFDRTVVIALTTLLRNRYGPVGPVKAVLGQVGDWSTIGQTRTLKMVGGRMDEEFTMLDRPNTFGYTLSNITGQLWPLLSRVEGLWTFAPIGTGTNITWQWTAYPRFGLSTVAWPVLDLLWNGYARKAFDVLSDYLLAPQGIR